MSGGPPGPRWVLDGQGNAGGAGVQRGGPRAGRATLEAPVGAWLAARRGTGGRGFRRAVPLHVRNRLDTQGEGKVDDGERVMKAGVGEGRDLGGRRGSGILQEQARRLYDDGLRRGRSSELHRVATRSGCHHGVIISGFGYSSLLVACSPPGRHRLRSPRPPTSATLRHQPENRTRD